jgi:hypothetical protein
MGLNDFVVAQEVDTVFRTVANASGTRLLLISRIVSPTMIPAAAAPR